MQYASPLCKNALDSIFVPTIFMEKEPPLFGRLKERKSKFVQKFYKEIELWLDSKPIFV